MANVQELIARIVSEGRQRDSAHFTRQIYRDEPIIQTGRQMTASLPDHYRRMRAISRWEQGGSHGRWLSEAELFSQQGAILADMTDDCPCSGSFKSYFPTYNAMSDRQLRGYVTWRSAVRAGRIEQTSLSFAFVYLYELINGIGVTDPADGFAAMKGFWSAYRLFEPDIDRHARVWLQDYVVYHGLDPQLLIGSEIVSFDRALSELDRAGAGAIGVPPDARREQHLLEAIDNLSSYRIGSSRLRHEHGDDLRHVACAVYGRLLDHYGRNRKRSLPESLFGAAATIPYVMFSSAVFFERAPHADTVYELDDIHSYRCRKGSWSCTRVHSARSRSSKLGKIMRAIDRELRARLDPSHPLRDEAVPKYLLKIICQEIDSWLSWRRAHSPRVIEIDLGRLPQIRDAAAGVREALLIDEEREDASRSHPGAGARTEDPRADPLQGAMSPEAASGRTANPIDETGSDGAAVAERRDRSERGSEKESIALDAHETAYLVGLIAGDSSACAQALGDAATSCDLLVDRINGKLFEAFGDTVVEIDDGGPRVIEDYEIDLKEILPS